MDHRNRNEVKCNLPAEEIEALEQLIKLQQDRKIVIKECDKGAGLIILTFKEYMKACYMHLTEELQTENETLKYYTPVSDFELDRTADKVTKLLEDALSKAVISKDEFKAMKPEGGKPAKFYCNFKVHKTHEPMKAPPVRPIVSGSGSIMENPGKYVQHHIKESAKQHKSYLKDTSDFLRSIDKINKENIIDDDSILVTWDVKGLYTNIPHEEGLKRLQDKLNQRTNPEAPTWLLVNMMELILKNNIFTFHDQLFRQDIGTAMGSPPAPDYANIFMEPIDIKIEELAAQKRNLLLLLLKRFLDDYFSLFKGSTKDIHKLFEEMNQMHPSIKFTMTHTSKLKESDTESCNCEKKFSIPFLDVLCSIKNGAIDTTLYRKETDKNMYLLPSSCHAKTVSKSIPYSLAIRIVRICSDPENRDKELKKLKSRLLNRNYDNKILESAIKRARNVPRQSLLKPVLKPEVNSRPVFAVTFDPRTPPFPSVLAKHWRAMTSQDAHLAQVFPLPPLVAYKRQRNIRDRLIRAQVPKVIQRYPKRQQRGMKKCQKDCPICPFISEGKDVSINNSSWKIGKHVNCETSNIIYAIQCTKENCQLAYIGETKRQLKYRIADHKSYIKSENIEQATGEHFNLPGHSISNMKVTIVERVKKNDDQYRKEREKYFINKFNTFYRGINRQLPK